MPAVLLSTLCSYVLGSVPTGLLVGKIGYGVDIRLVGSGNIGFTNVRRVLGNRPGFLVLALDALKGAAAVLGTAWAYQGSVGFPLAPDFSQSLAIVLAALGVLLGNLFSIFMGFKGGKGVGVAIGALLAMTPEFVAVLFIVWLAVRTLTGYVSVASLTISILFPVLMWLRYGENSPYLVFSVCAAALVVFSHRANIKRLMAGEELKYHEGKGRTAVDGR